MKAWKILKSQLAFNTPWFKVRQDQIELASGRILDKYYVWLNKDVSAIIPITSDNKFILVRQYRHGSRETTLEFPVGYVEKTETPKAAAKRELLEETGYLAKNMALIGKLINNASKETGNIFVYLAQNIRQSPNSPRDPNEDIKLKYVTGTELTRLILNGKIRVSFTVAAVFLSYSKLKKTIYT